MGEVKEGRPWRAAYERVIEAPVEKVWEVTRQFLRMNEWAPSIVKTCRLAEGETEGEGCVREIHGVMDTIANERLLSFDASAYRYTYTVETCTLPGFDGYESTFQLSDAGAGKTRVVWSYEHGPVTPAVNETQFRDAAFWLYESCLNDLQSFFSKPQFECPDA